ncbi:MAG: serine/threonine-protein phosphatase, partial [Candidatus Eremiobacteraeota bacterium]|nr:serine/threonine-protein phosphatase [Candidatus Eremiobacteraeota bacterium]
EVLPPTAPLIGVFDDQHHLFKQRHIEIEAGTVLVATTDGVTEARNAERELFGMDRLVSTVEAVVKTASTMNDIVEAILSEVKAFTGGRLHDDIALMAARIF